MGPEEAGCTLAAGVTGCQPRRLHRMLPTFRTLRCSGPFSAGQVCPASGALGSANEGVACDATPHSDQAQQTGGRGTTSPHPPSFVGEAEASTKAHLVAEAVPRGTTLFQ